MVYYILAKIFKLHVIDVLCFFLYNTKGKTIYKNRILFAKIILNKTEKSNFVK